MSTTKSAIDMLSRVLAEEQRFSLGRRLRVVSVAPGLVRTATYDAVTGGSADDAMS
jgi:NAD(P)-dependent dehydrogenase (short-subunit alcohol dehydrogenase family)